MPITPVQPILPSQGIKGAGVLGGLLSTFGGPVGKGASAVLSLGNAAKSSGSTVQPVATSDNAMMRRMDNQRTDPNLEIDNAIAAVDELGLDDDSRQRYLRPLIAAQNARRV